MHIRPEQPDDKPAVHALVAVVFGQTQEADLVDALRQTGELVVSLLAERDGHVIGHVGVSRLKSPGRALALAPVGVALHEQRRGIGSALVREALKHAARLGYAIVFVVGAPAYYSRFGFSSEAAAPFPCPYAGPNFMALWLSDDRMAPAPIVYADAFDALK